MTDTLISLETAKLAKEKGFDWPTAKAYDKCDMLCTYAPDRLINYNTSGFIKSAPTQSLLAKWLRDKGIHVWVYPHLGTEVWYTGAIWEVGSQAARELNNFDSSYEEAPEEGLFQALKLIS